MRRVAKGGRPGNALGIAAEELRRHNLATVLRHLHLDGASTRSRLTSITGLNRSTVADLIGELAELGLVNEEPGVAISGPGRPSPVVHLKPEGAVVLAVEISVDSIAVATIGIGGHVYNQIRIARPRGHFDPQTTVADIAELARPLLGALPAGHHLAGVGTAVVGIVRRDDGFVHLVPNLGWRDVALAELLSHALDLDVPVRVANDADLGALGEYRRGGLGSVSHLVYISGEVGIGCGVIADGKPLQGSAGYAGEVGHTLVNPQGASCECGGFGCWETEAGEPALLRRVDAVESTSGLAAVEAVMTLAEQGDEATIRALTDTGEWLGLGISNIINMYNPEVIVLGGLYYRFFDYLKDAATASARRAIGVSWDMVEIRRSAIGVNAPLVGAAELALTDLINNPALMSGA